MADPLLTEAQVAAHVRVHPRTVRRWRMAGLVTYERTPGGRIRYTLDDLILLQSRMHVEREPVPTCPPMPGERRAAAR